MFKEGHSLVFVQKHANTLILEECIDVSICIYYHAMVAMNEVYILTFKCGIIFKSCLNQNKQTKTNTMSLITLRFFILSAQCKACLLSDLP